MQDPYEAVKEEVVRSMTKLEGAYRKWKATEDPAQLAQQQSKLLEAIRIIEGDLNDLGDSIKVIRANRQKFGTVTDETLETRVRFIDGTRARLAQIKEDALQHQSQMVAKEQAKRPAGAKAKAATPATYAHLQEEPDTTHFINGHVQAQAEIEEEQEEALEDLTHAVKRLKVKGQEITDELKQHDAIIQDLDEEMNTLQGKMKHAARQLEKAMDEASQKTKLCCIFILIVILIVVTWLLFAL